MPARPISSYRVAKKFAPDQRGAIRLAQRYGAALVCVRHRHDPTGRHRIVTVELALEQVPIARRPSPIVGVRIGYGEAKLRATARAGGAAWDSDARLWRMPRSVARSLGLLGRITSR